jgi:two-component system chemotaxis response regulator CheB
MSAPRRNGPPRLIALGASTGGVEALAEVLAAFPADCPPTIVVQHMPEFFTRSFAGRLDGLCAARVEEAWDGAPLERGRVWLAPGGARHLEIAACGGCSVRLFEADPVNRHRPSVDVAFRSAARCVGRGAAAALLTGMGRDGALGLREMREAGARTYAQDRDSSAVWGMPRAALELGAVAETTPLSQIATSLLGSLQPSKEPLSWP